MRERRAKSSSSKADQAAPVPVHVVGAQWRRQPLGGYALVLLRSDGTEAAVPRPDGNAVAVWPVE